MKHRWLLLLAPLLLTGCGVLTGSPTATTSAADDGSGAGANSANPWQIYVQGSPTPSPTPSSGVPAYPVPTATGFLPITGGGARPGPTSTCGLDTVHFSRINALAVAAGTTSATASWYHAGGYNLVEYRLTAISQDLRYGKQRDVGWVTVKPATACGAMTATVTGLDRRTNYVFSLDAVVTRRSGDGTHAGTVYRSGVVATK